MISEKDTKLVLLLTIAELYSMVGAILNQAQGLKATPKTTTISSQYERISATQLPVFKVLTTLINNFIDAKVFGFCTFISHDGSLADSVFCALSLEPHFRFQRFFFKAEFFSQRSIP